MPLVRRNRFPAYGGRNSVIEELNCQTPAGVKVPAQQEVAGEMQRALGTLYLIRCKNAGKKSSPQERRAV
jgi:hypothetical protein